LFWRYFASLIRLPRRSTNDDSSRSAPSIFTIGSRTQTAVVLRIRIECQVGQDREASEVAKKSTGLEVQPTTHLNQQCYCNQISQLNFPNSWSSRNPAPSLDHFESSCSPVFVPALRMSARRPARGYATCYSRVSHAYLDIETTKGSTA
jgi:hypothetical protein